MVTDIWILSVTFGLYTSADRSDQNPQQWSDPNYNSKLKAIVDITWKALMTEIEQKQNVVIFSVPLLTDVAFIYDISDENTKEKFRKWMAGFEVKELNLADTADDKFRQSFSTELRFKTIFYAFGLEAPDLIRLKDFIKDKRSPSNNRFKVIVEHRFYHKNILKNLVAEVESDSIGTTCEVRYCPLHALFSSQPPFAIVTLASWSITSVDGFEMNAPAEFALSDSSVVKVRVVQGFAKFDRAQFQYSNGCIARVLRLPYKLNFNLIFVIPAGAKSCRFSQQLLWSNVQNVNFNDLAYESEFTFIRIPVFRISANIDLKKKITNVAAAFDQPSSILHGASAFQAAEVIFDPRVPLSLPRPADLQDVATFLAQSPFFFALFHVTMSTPAVAGLINYPGCTHECKAENF